MSVDLRSTRPRVAKAEAIRAGLPQPHSLVHQRVAFVGIRSASFR
jgi:hypothetical protein